MFPSLAPRKRRRLHRSRRESKRFFKPLTEQLEPRWLLSVSASVSPERVLQIDDVG